MAARQANTSRQAEGDMVTFMAFLSGSIIADFTHRSKTGYNGCEASEPEQAGRGRHGDFHGFLIGQYHRGLHAPKQDGRMGSLVTGGDGMDGHGPSAMVTHD